MTKKNKKILLNRAKKQGKKQSSKKRWIRNVKHVNVSGIITKTTKDVNMGINTENVTTYTLAKLRKKMIDIREKKAKNLRT
jgi:hypothetical protein